MRVIDESKIAVMVVGPEYRGDHSADIATARSVREGETVAELVARVWSPGRDHPDRIELRVVDPLGLVPCAGCKSGCEPHLLCRTCECCHSCHLNSTRAGALEDHEWEPDSDRMHE